MKKALLLLMVALFPLQSIAAPTATLTANPTSGISPVSVTLTWSCTESTSATASGGWTGVKALSGTEVISGVKANTTFTLTCSSATSNDATLTWTHPTEYTDATPIPDGAITATDIQYGVCNAGQSGISGTPTQVSVPYPAAEKVISPLDVGWWCFQARTVAGGVSSEWTMTVFKFVGTDSVTASANVTVTKKPRPPGGGRAQ